MTPSIEAKIVVIEEETGIGANTKLRIGEVLREIANEKPYKVYTALLNQTGTDDPIPTVLQNTLGGDIIWTRDLAGEYIGTLPGIFDSNKTTIQIIANTGQGYTTLSEVVDIDSIHIIMCNWMPGGVEPIPADDLLSNTPIEIRVYN